MQRREKGNFPLPQFQYSRSFLVNTSYLHFIHLFHYLNFIDMDYIKTGTTSRYLLCIFLYVTYFTAQFACRFMQVCTLDFLGFSVTFGVLVQSHWPTYLLMLIGWPYLWLRWVGHCQFALQLYWISWVMDSRPNFPFYLFGCLSYYSWCHHFWK